MLSLSEVVEKYFTHFNGYKVRDDEAYKKHGFIDVKKLGATGDGVTDDYPVIQNALDTFKNIYIPEGVYCLSDTLIMPDNSHIICDPLAHMVAKHTFKLVINAKPDEQVGGGYNANSNITIDGGIWDMNYNEYKNTRCNFVFGHAHNITLKNITFVDTVHTHCVELAGCKDSIIENCYFKGFITPQTDNPENTNTYVEAIQLEPCHRNGFSYFGESDLTHCENITVKNCIFDKNPERPESSFFFAVLGTHGTRYGVTPANNIFFENNIVMGCTFAGVRPYHWEQVHIVGNEFINCARAVMLDGTPNAQTDTGGTDSQTGVAYTCKNIYVNDNTFTNCNPCVWAYTRINDSTVTKDWLENIHIHNNTAKKCGTFIYSLLSKKVEIIGNQFEGTDKTIIDMTDCVDTVINGNVFDNTSSNATNIRDLTVESGVTQNVSITNNIFKKINAHSVNIRSVKNVYVSSNIFDDCSKLITETDSSYVVNVNNFVDGFMFTNNIIRHSTRLLKGYARLTGIHNNALMILNNRIENYDDYFLNSFTADPPESVLFTANNIIS